MRFPIRLLLLLLLVSCKRNGPTPSEVQFASEPTAAALTPGQIDEASGMADSRSMPGSLWVQQDSGSPADIALVGHDGQVKGKLSLPAIATNRDWEDMGIGPGPQAGINYLYLADIGDNNAQYPGYVIYRFPEPKSLSEPISQVERINFRYPDGARDAEAILVDPQTRDIWIVTKREQKARLYRFAYPQNINEVTTVQLYGELPFSVVTGGSISSDGTEILLRTYTNVYYWKREANELLADALQKREGRMLPYRLEPQGEAIAFDKDNKGYYTLSERSNAVSVSLFYYAKK